MPRFQRASAESVAEGEKSLTFELTVPEKARRSKKDPKDARWLANLQITEASAEETQSQKGDNHLVCTVTGVILPGAMDDGANLDRTVSMRARLNYEAFNAGDKKSKQYKMHQRTIGVLTQLARAAGLYEGGDLTEDLLEAMFPDGEGVQSCLIGKNLLGEIHQAPNPETGRTFPEIDAWPVTDGSPVVGAGTPVPAGAVTL